MHIKFIFFSIPLDIWYKIIICVFKEKIEESDFLKRKRINIVNEARVLSPLTSYLMRFGSPPSQWECACVACMHASYSRTHFIKGEGEREGEWEREEGERRERERRGNHETSRVGWMTEWHSADVPSGVSRVTPCPLSVCIKVTASGACHPPYNIRIWLFVAPTISRHSFRIDRNRSLKKDFSMRAWSRSTADERCTS